MNNLKKNDTNSQIRFSHMDYITNGALRSIEIPSKGFPILVLHMSEKSTLGPSVNDNFTEKIVVIEGNGWIRIGGQINDYQTGSHIKIPEYIVHNIFAETDTTFYLETTSCKGIMQSRKPMERYPLYQLVYRKKKYLINLDEAGEFFFKVHSRTKKRTPSIVGNYVIDNLGAFPRKMTYDDLTTITNKVLEIESKYKQIKREKNNANQT